MSDTHRRVYHPTLDSWRDVPTGDADKWKKAGWRLTAPDHVDESDAPKVGEGRGTVDIPRETWAEVGYTSDSGVTTTGRAAATTTGDTSS